MMRQNQISGLSGPREAQNNEQNMPNNINGSWRDNTLTGTDEDDKIKGKSGSDTLEGKGGDDTLTGDSGDDTLLGGTGNDELEGGSSHDALSGGDGNDTLHGDSGDDLLSGGDGDDVLDGGWGADTIFGGDGNDTITAVDGDVVDGGAGDDQIDMGGHSGGSDTIVFGAGSGHDTVTGWSPESDNIHIGGASPADVTLTPTADPQVWVMTLDGAPDASLTLDFTYHWDSSIGEADIRARILTSDDTPLPQDPYGPPICLTTGAMIDTAAGPCPIEALRPGDLVLTRDAGAQPLRANLHRHVPAAAQAADPALRPVVIEAGAFGGGLPGQRMLVSLQHAFLAHDPRPGGKGEVLIRARHVAEELGKARHTCQPFQPVTYFHLLFDRHQLIRADGVWTESVFAGAEALRADPVLRSLLRGAPAQAMQERIRPLLLRKHLKRYRDHDLGHGAPVTDPCNTSAAWS